MSVLKNSFGVSVSFKPKISPINFVNKMAGSSLERKPRSEISGMLDKSPVEVLLDKPLTLDKEEDTDFKPRSLSQRSKSKIRRKVIAFARLHKKLSFVTLTFVNKVTDRQGIKILGAFLDNVSKRSKDFQYVWVAERQTKNKVFKDNLHFHLVANKYWSLERWWNYWLGVQEKNGIVPRKKGSKPTSTFHVDVIYSNNIKRISNYLVKYLSKNTAELRCAAWNCSRKISRLYTAFYSDQTFLEDVKRLDKTGKMKRKIKTIKLEHCDVHLIPMNNMTTRLYDKIDEQNRLVWQMNDATAQATGGKK